MIDQNSHSYHLRQMLIMTNELLNRNIVETIQLRVELRELTTIVKALLEQKGN